MEGKQARWLIGWRSKLLVHRLDAERAPLPLSEVAKALLVCNNRFGSKLEDEKHHKFWRIFQPIFDLSLQPFN
ncbi:MAG: hypothetical protein U7126_16855 [Microcoleus sp.]